MNDALDFLISGGNSHDALVDPHAGKKYKIEGYGHGNEPLGICMEWYSRTSPGAKCSACFWPIRLADLKIGFCDPSCVREVHTAPTFLHTLYSFRWHFNQILAKKRQDSSRGPSRLHVGSIYRRQKHDTIS